MKKQFGIFAASFVAISSLLSFAAIPMASAAADTCTWTGAGNGTTFSDGANWSGCDNGGVPEATDTLTFGSTGTAVWNLTNNLGHAVAGVVVTASSSDTNYTINTLTLANGATIDGSQSETSTHYTSVAVNSVTAQGTLTQLGGGFGATTWAITGVLTLDGATSFDGASVGSAGVVVRNGAKLDFSYGTTTTSTFPITLGGGSGTAKPIVQFSGKDQTAAFGNPITLLGDAYITLAQTGMVVNQTGSITGAGFALSLDPESATGSTLNLNPSSNNSATVPGTYKGSGAGTANGGGSDPVATTNAKAPSTGLAVITANPLQTLAITALLGSGIYFLSRRVLAKSAVRR